MASDRVSGDELMGRNAYAAHQGVSPGAVAKAIKSGRITKSVLWGPGGKVKGIRWRQADELWAANTDQREALRTRKRRGPELGADDPPRVQTLGRRPSSPAPPAMAKQRELSRLLGKIFGASAITWAADLVVHHELEPEIALDAVESGLFVLNMAAIDVLGIVDPAGNCEALIPDELALIRAPALRLKFLDQVRAAAKILRQG
jgi:hypothetical protein